MSVKIICDVCGQIIPDVAPVNVFRMWNISAAVHVADNGLRHITIDQDYYICDRCFEQLSEFAEQMRKADS